LLGWQLLGAGRLALRFRAHGRARLARLTLLRSHRLARLALLVRADGLAGAAHRLAGRSAATRLVRAGRHRAAAPLAGLATGWLRWLRRLAVGRRLAGRLLRRLPELGCLPGRLGHRPSCGLFASVIVRVRRVVRIGYLRFPILRFASAGGVHERLLGSYSGVGVSALLDRALR
jgi:hypothetical protein